MNLKSVKFNLNFTAVFVITDFKKKIFYEVYTICQYVYDIQTKFHIQKIYDISVYTTLVG
jgi:hypothetical protein